MTEITQEGWKNKALSMLLAQLTSYVLFIAATVIPSPGTVPIIPLIIAALTLAAFVVFWPFRGSILDRIVTLVFGAISLIFVIVPFPTSEVPPDQTAADGSVLPWYSWALAMGLLLVVLVVFSFGRQMAREKREHLIRALSHAVTSGVAALAVAGWCFLPDLGAMLAKGTVAGTVALIILIVLATGFGRGFHVVGARRRSGPGYPLSVDRYRPDAGNADGRDHRRNRTGARPYHRLMDVHRSIFRKLVTYVSTTSA